MKNKILVTKILVTLGDIFSGIIVAAIIFTSLTLIGAEDLIPRTQKNMISTSAVLILAFEVMVFMNLMGEKGTEKSFFFILAHTLTLALPLFLLNIIISNTHSFFSEKTYLYWFLSVSMLVVITAKVSHFVKLNKQTKNGK